MRKRTGCPNTVYWVRHEFFDIFKLAAIPSIWILSPNHKREKLRTRQRKKRKKAKKVSFLFFGHLFLSPKKGLSKRSSRLCTGRSRCGYKVERGGETKKRDSDTERACNCPKRRANYGPSSPVSIPTPGKSLAQIWVAKWRILENFAPS